MRQTKAIVAASCSLNAKREIKMGRANLIRICIGALILFGYTSCFAQTPDSLSLGDGTLNFNTTTETDYCEQASPNGPEEVPYTAYIYDSFSFTENGTTTPLDGTAYHVFTSGSHCSPPPTDGENPLAMKLPNGGTIKFSMSGRGSRSATISNLIDPLYKVVSILYTAPGNASSDGFTNTTTNGTVTTIGQSFTNDVSQTFSQGWLLGGYSVTFGTSITTGNSTAFTETIANASSISNVSASSGPNTIGHNQDMFLIWLNPEVELTSGFTNLNYEVHTQYQNGVQEPPDIIELPAASMQALNGITNVPISILRKQYNPSTGQYDLPGLAAICANQSEYQNNCPNGGQCGCVPGDFADVLATDPLLNTTTADNPMNVDASGAGVCANPQSTNSCRYVPVPSSVGSGAPMTTLLSGPACQGCNRPVNGYTQTDSTQTTQTLSEQTSQYAGFSVKFGPALANISFASRWTWTSMESVGAINGQQNSLQYSLSSGTVGCYQDVLVYEDTVFHTFVTQQAPGNGSCP